VLVAWSSVVDIAACSALFVVASSSLPVRRRRFVAAGSSLPVRRRLYVAA